MTTSISDRLVVLGQGYVGLPLAMRAVQAGFDVIGFDVAESKIGGLAVGRTHIDDVTDSDVAEALATGRYRPTTIADDLAAFDMAVITVPTPLRDGAPDLVVLSYGLARFAWHRGIKHYEAVGG